MSDRALLDVTETIYGLATGETPWDVLGHSLMRLVGAESASIMMSDGSAPTLLHRGNIPDDAAMAYAAHFQHIDPWTLPAARVVAGSPQPVVRAWISGDLGCERTFERGEFYNDFGRPNGLRYVVGTVLPLGEDRLLPIGLHRPEAREPFERGHARLLEGVLPHLRRAMQLRLQLLPAQEETRRASFGALDALASGVLVLDAEFGVYLINAAAEALCRADGPLRLQKRSCHRPATIRALHASDHEAFRRAVQSTAAGASAGGGVALRDADGAPSAAALVSPLPARLAGAVEGALGRVPNRALVFLRNLRPEPRQLTPDLLRALFGLTRAEAEVALQLRGGATRESVAVLRNAQLSTVRTQVRAVLAKTGTANLRDLERLLASLA